MKIRTVVIAAILAGVAGCMQGNVDPIGPSVTVQGEAKVEVVPDELVVEMSVTRLAKEVQDAATDVNRRTTAALAAAKQAGVADADIRALAISVQPQYDWREGEQLFRGHEASRSIRLVVRDIDAWPRLLNALVEAGVDRIDDVEPRHSDQQRLAREALRDAVADARARADVLAQAAGATVSTAYSIAETGRNYTVARPQAARADMMVASAPPPEAAFEPGTITLTANVRIVFRLDDGR